MAEQTLTRRKIPQFAGLRTNIDSHDLEPGEFQVQRNLKVVQSRGNVGVRGGMVPLSFANGIGPTTNDVVSLGYARPAGVDVLVYADSAGNVKAGKGPWNTAAAQSGTIILSGVVTPQVAKIIYTIDGIARFSVTSAPFTASLDTTTCSNDVHDIVAISYDAFGGVVAENTFSILVSNATGLSMPKWLVHKGPNKTFQLSYKVPVSPDTLTILTNRIDICLGDHTAQVRGAGDIYTPLMRYNVVTEMAYYITGAWLEYAETHAYSREDAFYHCGTHGQFHYTNGFGSVGFPVRSWWDCWQVTAGGSGTNKGDADVRSSPGTPHIGCTQADDGAHSLTLGTTSGDYILLGYPDRIDELNWVLSVFASGGFTGQLEYADTVNGSGVPTHWTAFTLTSDTTSGLTASGKMRFNPNPSSPPWVRSVGFAGSIAARRSFKLFYLRYKTTNTGTAPHVTTVTPADYTGQGTGDVADIPQFNPALDLNGDGYIEDAQYVAGSGAVPNARFYYQSRMPSNLGTNEWFGNFTNQTFRDFAVQYVNADIIADPEFDGVWLDDSNVSTLFTPSSQTVENAQDTDLPYGMFVNQLWRALGTSPRGSRFVICNSHARKNLVQQAPWTWWETKLRDNHNWAQVDSYITDMDLVRTYYSPEPPQVLDSRSTYGQTLDRYQILILAYYLTLSSAGTYISPFADDSPQSDWEGGVKWFDAIAVDFGQPQGGTTLVGNDIDPNDPGKTYKVYKRVFDNAIVLFKPLSSDGTFNNDTPSVGSGTNADLSSTTHVLNATYYPLAADGTRGAGVTSVDLRNAEAKILMKTP